MKTEAVLEQSQDPTELKEVPLTALRWVDSCQVQFAAKPGAQDDASSRDVSILARTNEPLYHWWWGWCVHDMAGIEHKDRIVLDYCHDEDELIGFADKFPVGKEGLTVQGRIESIEPDDQAAKILKRSDRGIPYEGSIYFQPLLLEYVEGGATAEVNGTELKGPMTIFRKWRLRAVAVCPHGYDYGSQTSFKADAQSTCTLNWKERPMSNTQAESPTTGDTATSASTQPEGARAQFQAELKRFTDKFGAEGAKYFGDGLSWDQALEKHIDQLTADRTAEKQRADDAEAKLNAVKSQLGESEGIDTGKKPSTSKATGFSDLVRPRS